VSLRGALQIGVVVAAVIAGPPLYGAVQRGALPSGTALTYGFVVAVACTVGASMVLRLVDFYAAEQEEKARAELREEQAEAAEAARKAAAAASAAGAPQTPPTDVR
jgi:hypothetical protein